jgi:hypothetical protein
VKIGADGSVRKATFESITPGAPGRDALCTTQFARNELPWPPPNSEAPATRCGGQRPGINVAPAVARDGTVYTISRAHLNERWGNLVAVNPDLSPKWVATLRNRMSDGCNVLLPPNGTPGGCRAGATTGVNPLDNELGSGYVVDNATSSPVVAPDGRILYGALTRYNYQQGHLMMFEPDGRYVNSYSFGWDITPAIYLTRAMQRRQLAAGIDANTVESDVKMPSSLVNGVFYGLARLSTLWPWPSAGSSVFYALD